MTERLQQPCPYFTDLYAGCGGRSPAGPRAGGLAGPAGRAPLPGGRGNPGSRPRRGGRLALLAHRAGGVHAESAHLAAHEFILSVTCHVLMLVECTGQRDPLLLQYQVQSSLTLRKAARWLPYDRWVPASRCDAASHSILCPMHLV